MDKIKILLIDDNPTSLMKDEGKGSSFLPSFDYGFSTTEFQPEAISSNFELGWLQSPRDVREFRVFSEDIIQRFGPTVLLNDGFVPEIVLFDYKLGEGLSKYIDYDLEEEFKSVIPTYRLSKILDETPHRYFDWKELNSEIENITKEMGEQEPPVPEDKRIGLAKIAIKKASYEKLRANEPAIFFKSKDDMGCFSGGLIAFQFKDYPCVGVPITSKNGEIDVSEEALYFEWLLSKDFDDQFGKKYGKKPFWNEVIPQAVLLLRNRIELLVKLGKITPSYDQLNQLSKGNEQSDRILSFTSAYGVRHLPLDGLLIDGKETAEIWAARLIQRLPKSTADIEKALEISELLWGVFTRDFGRRIDLSNLAYWEQDPDRQLTPEEQTVFAQLKQEFGVKNGEIEGETSIQGLFSEKKKKKNQVNFTIRLTVLHLAARAAIEMNKCRKNASQKAIYEELNEYEYFNLLFPIVSLRNDVVLPMHKEDGKDDLIEQGRNWAYRKLGTTQGYWLDFGKWITPGEKSLLRSIYFAQDEYYPDWLKQ